MNENVTATRTLAVGLVAALLCQLAVGKAEQPVFHFNFGDANGKQEILDTTGKVRCRSQGVAMLAEHGALRLAEGACITIPADQKVPIAKQGLTVKIPGTYTCTKRHPLTPSPTSSGRL